jgi:hypothetical protein
MNRVYNPSLTRIDLSLCDGGDGGVKDLDVEDLGMDQCEVTLSVYPFLLYGSVVWRCGPGIFTKVDPFTKTQVAAWHTTAWYNHTRSTLGCYDY